MSQRLLAIGDIHGCFDAFRMLIENVIRLTKDDTLILLGDYIDRGTQSKQVIDYIIQLQTDGYSIITLMGNHESMLLNAAEDIQTISLWLMNGGMTTLNSFGITFPSKLNTRYLCFFNSLKHYHIFGDYLFVHAGFNDSIPNPFEDVDSMLWSRISSYSHPLLINKTIVHGHTPISLTNCENSINNKSGVINLDTGCVYENRNGCGYLTGYDIFSHTLYSVAKNQR